MDYKILSHSDDECFIEITKDTFRTRIEFNFAPNEDFRGIAVCCNYHFKGHPVGFLKDNGLVLRQIDGHRDRALFKIPENSTVIQAGPSLINESKPTKDYKSEHFATHYILSGFHAHIGRKKSGNYLVGFSKKLTFNGIIDKYLELNAEEAIKLPGFDKGAFYFASSHQIIKEGTFPIVCALVFEKRLE